MHQDDSVCSQVQMKLIEKLGAPSKIIDMAWVQEHQTPVHQLLSTIRPVISSVEKAKAMTENGVSTPRKLKA